jgi:molybdopterin-binding protein
VIVDFDHVAAIGVGRHYGRRRALTDISFTAASGDIVGLLGPNGAGKSTLLAILGTLLAASTGRVAYGATDLAGDRADVRRRIGMLGHDLFLYPELSARENLTFFGRLYDVPDAATKAVQALERAGLAPRADDAVAALSRGMRQRVALERALLHQPRLLLLDEPFAGLDERRRREAMSLLDHTRRRFGLPMVLVSHFAEEVIALTEMAVRLEGGRVAAVGPSASVLRAGETQIDNFFTAQVIGPSLVRAGHVDLHAYAPEGASGDVRMGCYAHDILLATSEPKDISARNVMWTMATAVEPAGEAVLVTLAAPPVKALVTRDASERLGLEAGKRLVVIIKATSIAFLGPAS